MPYIEMMQEATWVLDKAPSGRNGVRPSTSPQVIITPSLQCSNP